MEKLFGDWTSAADQVRPLERDAQGFYKQASENRQHAARTRTNLAKMAEPDQPERKPWELTREQDMGFSNEYLPQYEAQSVAAHDRAQATQAEATEAHHREQEARERLAGVIQSNPGLTLEVNYPGW
jgi:hypothetical protein